MNDPVHPEDEVKAWSRRGARITALHEQREIPYPESASADHEPYSQFVDDAAVLASLKGRERMKNLADAAHWPGLKRTIDGKRGE